MTLAVAASFAAATISLINVALTGRLSRRSQAVHWRRDVERSVAAAFLGASNECTKHWDELVISLFTLAEAHDVKPKNQAEINKRYGLVALGWSQSENTLKDLGLKYGELSLLSSPTVSAVAFDLLKKHEQIRTLFELPVDMQERPTEVTNMDHVDAVAGLHSILIRELRRDMGIQNMSLSVWARFLGRLARRRSGSALRKN